jgi:hypothetical protein
MPADIALQRLHNQRIEGSTLTNPAQLVGWLGAVQAQEYPAAKWALGVRLQGVTDADVDKALADGSILRTHLMRPTWHFVAPEDIRWMLALTAPRVRADSAYWIRQHELDDATFARSNEVIGRTLQGGKQLTRVQLEPALQAAGIETVDTRFSYLMMHAELEGLVCSGARQGKQFTYALLDERVPKIRTLSREEALAELARRYFTGHGPATLKDYIWWSGLTAADARAGLNMVKAGLLHETIGDETYWFAETPAVTAKISPAVYLLPVYDEYIVGYAERSAVYQFAPDSRRDARSNVLFYYTIVIDGQVVGTWKRTVKTKAVIVETTRFRPFSDAEDAAFAAAAQRYGDFLGLPVQITQEK